MIEAKRAERLATFAALGIAATYAIASILPTFVDFWIQTAPHELGDLRDRFREFNFFAQGLDPKKQDPLLGYPAWSYLMSGIWAWPKSFEAAKLLFLGLQTLSIVLVFRHLRSTL